jgi:hypothetical protein
VGDSLEAPAGAVQGEREVMRRRALGKFRWSVRPAPPSQGKLGVGRDIGPCPLGLRPSFLRSGRNIR